MMHVRGQPTTLLVAEKVQKDNCSGTKVGARVYKSWTDSSWNLDKNTQQFCSVASRARPAWVSNCREEGSQLV